MICMSAVIEQLMLAGVTGDALVTAVRKIEDAKVSSGALRQRRYRERQESVTVTSQALQSPPLSSPPSFPPTPPNTTPPTISPTKIHAQSAIFLDFWDVFPRQRRGSRGKAWKIWQNCLKNGATEEKIYAGARKYAESSDVQRGFACGAAVWLGNERWNDEPSSNHPITTANGKPAYGDSLAHAAATVLDNIRREEEIRNEEIH